MNKQLLLMRHAEARETESGSKDIHRPLTETGVRDASIVGRYLYGKSFSPDRIIASSAIRTRETAELLAEQVKYDTSRVQYEPEIYEASVRTLLGLINNFKEDWRSVALIGHNPAISYIAEYLTKADIGGMASCGIVLIQFATPWNEISEGVGTLEFYEDPGSVKQKM